MNDIRDKTDIKIIVDSFYQEIRANQTIGPVFNKRIAAKHWPLHLEKMYAFWNTVLFGQPDYKGNPFSKHADLPISKIHFDLWVSMFCKIIDENYCGEKANEAKWRAEKMSQMFQLKIQNIRDNQSYQSIM